MVAPSPLSGFSRITLSAPRTQADVAVPNTIPIAAFLPVLLRQVGQDTEVSVPGRSGWLLYRTNGARVDLSRSMDANEVRDGEILVLQPAGSVVEAALFDDVVELVGRDGTDDRWSAQDRRRSAGLVGALSALVVLAALVRLPRHGVLEAGVCVAVALLLLLAGMGVSRAAGDLAGGAVVAGLAGPFAAVGAALFRDGSWSAARILLAAAALLLVAAVLPALVGGYEGIAGGYSVLALFGILGAGLALLDDVDPDEAAAVVAPLALAITTVLPLLALRLARLPRPQLALTAPELAELPGEVDQAVAVGRVASSRALLTGLTTGALAAAAAGTVALAASDDRWAQALAAVLVVLVLLRTRLYAARQTVTVAVSAAALALAGVAVVALTASGTRPLVVAAGVAGGVALAALLVALTAGRWTGTPRQRRLVDLLETLLLVSVAPLVLGVWRVYDTVFHLGD